MAFQHLLGAIELLRLRCQNPLTEETHQDLYVLMAESVLFHVSTLLISNPSFTKLEIDPGLWEWVEVILSKPVYENHPPPARHPILGTPRKLNRLIFEISKLSMQATTKEMDMEKIRKLDAELRQWEDNRYPPDRQSDGDPYLEVRRLYVICARILLMTTEMTASQIQGSTLKQGLRRQILKAVEIIRVMESTDGDMWNFIMRWPLRVLCCAVENGEEKEVVRDSLRRIWAKSACGDVRRTLCQLEG